MMETLKAAVVGAGAMGGNHARIYNLKQDTELVAVCDLDSKLSKKVGQNFRCKSFSNLGEMLSSEKPDVVTIATPTQNHVDTAIKCINAGVNVLVEKPISESVKNAKKIIAAAKKHDVKLMVGHIERFNPAVVELKKRLHKKALGRIYTAAATRVGPFPNRIRDVGVVVDLAVHDIDIMRYVTDSEITRVYAETEKKIHTSHEDMLYSLLKFENKSVGILDINWLTPEKIRELKVVGEKGMFMVKYISQELTFFENKKALEEDYSYQKILMGVTEGDIIKIRIPKVEPLKAELDAFTYAVAKNQTVPVTGVDGLKAVEIAQAIIKSSKKNQPIKL